MYRHYFNFFPSYRGSGGRVVHIAADWSEVIAKLPLNWRTRNYVGSIFGGSLYAAADPIFMLQLIKILGDNYVVWDKAAAIRFVRPGVRTLYARFEITEELLAEVRAAVAEQKEYVKILYANWVDEDGTVYAAVEKTLYIADKAYYQQKRAAKKAAKMAQP